MKKREGDLNVTASLFVTEFRSCVKVEVVVLGSPSLTDCYGLRGRKATLNMSTSELRYCVIIEVTVLGPRP